MPPTESRNRKINTATRWLYWKWRRWKSIAYYPYTQVLGHWSYEFIFKANLKLRVWKQKKSNMATRWPFWTWYRWKSIGFCLWPLSTSIWNLKWKYQSRLDLRSGNHAACRAQKPKNQIWPPGGHFENDVTENQKTSTHIHKYCANEVWGWYSKPNLNLSPEKNPI